MSLQWSEYSARRAGERNARHDTATLAGLTVAVFITVAILAASLIDAICK